MMLRSQFSLINSEFNEFLFATVGEEKSGSELTVLSALTRLELDPWGEAARLSALPAETAARALAAAIALLPEGDWRISELGAIAARLVKRLPRHHLPALPSFKAERSREGKKKAVAAICLVCIALGIGALFATSHLRSDHLSESPASSDSSTQR